MFPHSFLILFTWILSFPFAESGIWANSLSSSQRCYVDFFCLLTERSSGFPEHNSCYYSQSHWRATDASIRVDTEDSVKTVSNIYTVMAFFRPYCFFQMFPQHSLKIYCIHYLFTLQHYLNPRGLTRSGWLMEMSVGHCVQCICCCGTIYCTVLLPMQGILDCPSVKSELRTYRPLLGYGCSQLPQVPADFPAVMDRNTELWADRSPLLPTLLVVRVFWHRCPGDKTETGYQVSPLKK